eukprot:403368193
MKNRSGQTCNHCKSKIKSPTSLTAFENKRSCNCQSQKSKSRGQRNSSKYSDKSNSHSRCSTKPQMNHNLLLNNQSVPTQYQSYQQRSPRGYIDAGSTMTNLKIAGCEFPVLQTARNPPTNDFFHQENLGAQSFQRASQFQQPFQSVPSFSNLNQPQFLSSQNQQFSHRLSQNFNTQSPFRGQQNAELMASTQKMRSFSPGQRDYNTLTPSKQIFTHYDRVVQEFELYSKQRAITLREGLQKIVEGLNTDDIISAMREDPLSQNYAFQRMKELVDNMLISESEMVIGNIRAENVLLREKILILEAENQKGLSFEDKTKLDKKLKSLLTKKNTYKQKLKQSQDQITQLLHKFKEVEKEILNQQSQFDLKIAQKDGELMRYEKDLSELRVMLQDKSINQNKQENTLNSEVKMLSDRIVNLEKEKVELIDKYQKYGEEFKQMLVQEQNQHQVKSLKYKDQINELKTHFERANSQSKDQEIKINNQLKEIDTLKQKIEDLLKQSQEKTFKIKDVEEQQTIQEKDLQCQLREQKSRYKNKIKELQFQFEQALTEKIHQLDNETREKLIQVESEKREFDQKFNQLQDSQEQKVLEEKQSMIIVQKQMEKKIEKLQVKYEQEIQSKLNEAEEQFKEMEANLKKEFKKEKKQFIQAKEQEFEIQQSQVLQMQERYENEFRDMSLKLRQEIDELQKFNQEQRIKIAELTILGETHKAEAERLTKENEKYMSQQRELIMQNKMEVQQLEDKLQQKIQENDDKVKLALDSAIKNSNLESITQQYAHEIDKKQSEIQSLKDHISRLNQKIEKAEEEFKIVQLELQIARQLSYDKEFKICKLQQVNKEALSKIFQFVRLQSSKNKQELEYLKRHFTSELEMSKKHMESQLLAIISKARENSYTQKFKLEKLQYHYEQRFQKEFNVREAEWEKVWEKREEIISQKDKAIKDLETERLSSREILVKQEGEINVLKSQFSQAKKDLTQQIENYKLKINSNEVKFNETVQSYKKQEEQLVNQQRQQLLDLKLQLQQKSQDELKKLEIQMVDFKDKNKQKVTDLAQHIQESQQKHKQEIMSMKQIYEEKIKSLESENDEQQRNLYEGQNKINMLQIKYEQFIKDNELMEQQIIDLSQKVKDLTISEVTLKQTEMTLKQEKDELLRAKQQLEKDLNDFDTQNRTLKTQIYAAERKYVQQRNELKKKMKRLNQSKQRELQEVQFLNDILTKVPTSATKQLQRDRSVKSPDFRRNQASSQAFQTQRGAETQRLNQSQSNYGDILSEINNMIDAKQVRLSCSNGKSLNLGQSQRFGRILSSPSVGQLNPSSTFHHKSILKSPSSQYNDENVQMKISDLRQK